MELDPESDNKEENCQKKPAIRIILINGIPHIWDAEEYISLRRDHRICGYLDGSSTRQNSAKGPQALPARLSNVEACYLIRHGIAEAYQIPSLSVPRPMIPKEAVRELNEQRRVEQLEIHRNKRKFQIESVIDKIIEGKRKKGRGLVPDRETVIQEEMEKVKLPYETTQIDLKDPWIKDSDYVPCDIPIPDSSLEKLRHKVFEDFHFKREYFVSVGLKFGGDFLAYPDDPIRCHSEFIILCHDASRGTLPPCIGSLTRLANTVKKKLLVATLDEKNDSVKYRLMNTIKMQDKKKRKRKPKVSVRSAVLSNNQTM